MRQGIWKNCAKKPCHAKTNARQGIFLKREEKAGKRSSTRLPLSAQKMRTLCLNALHLSGLYLCAGVSHQLLGSGGELFVIF